MESIWTVASGLLNIKATKRLTNQPTNPPTNQCTNPPGLVLAISLITGPSPSCSLINSLCNQFLIFFFCFHFEKSFSSPVLVTSCALSDGTDNVGQHLTHENHDTELTIVGHVDIFFSSSCWQYYHKFSTAAKAEKNTDTILTLKYFSSSVSDLGPCHFDSLASFFQSRKEKVYGCCNSGLWHCKLPPT